MKNVNYIVIIPKLGLWSTENNARVRDESRSLGYFLGEKLKQRKARSDLFSGLYFKGILEPKNIFYTNNLINIEIVFFENTYPSKGLKREINEYLISRVDEGCLKIKELYPEIVDVIIEGIDDFREQNYRCQWIHKKKKISDKIVQLRCEMDVDFFQLYIEIINKKKDKIYSKCIMEAPPNEYSFKHKFKDILIEGEVLYVTDKFDEKWFALNFKDNIS